LETSLSRQSTVLALLSNSKQTRKNTPEKRHKKLTTKKNNSSQAEEIKLKKTMPKYTKEHQTKPHPQPAGNIIYTYNRVK